MMCTGNLWYFLLVVAVAFFLGISLQAQKNDEIILNYNKTGEDTLVLAEFKLVNQNLRQIIESFLEEFHPCIKEAKDCVVMLSLERKEGVNYIHLSINDARNVHYELKGVISLQRPIFVQSNAMGKMENLVYKTNNSQSVVVEYFESYPNFMIQGTDTLYHDHYPNGANWFYKQKWKKEFQQVSKSDCDMNFIKSALKEMQDDGWKFPD